MIMNWLQKMMYGRYGTDQLNIALLIFSMLLTLVIQLIGYSLAFSTAVMLTYHLLCAHVLAQYSPAVSEKQPIFKAMEPREKLVFFTAAQMEG